jgi:hypothetical protein
MKLLEDDTPNPLYTGIYPKPRILKDLFPELDISFDPTQCDFMTA